MTEPLIRRGRVWKFGDNINTDLIFPNAAFKMSQGEQHRMVFHANRPDWVDQVRPGDILIAGSNFGLGSGRPIGRLLMECGIAGIAVESINGLALRNCVNFGMPALECPGVANLFEEGQAAAIDYATGTVTNETTGVMLQGLPLPPFLAEVAQGGGIIPALIKDGLIEAHPTNASAE